MEKTMPPERTARRRILLLLLVLLLTLFSHLRPSYRVWVAGQALPGRYRPAQLSAALAVCPECTWESALSISITSLSNIGPGAAQIGPACDFDWLNPAAKLLSAFEMLIGRLELFTILVLFLPSFWRK